MAAGPLHVAHPPVNVPAMLRHTTGLYVITRPLPGGPDALASAVDQAIAGGAVMVQYREKGGVASTRQEEAAAVLRVCRAHAVPLVINDDIGLARQVGADGVHLGRHDASVPAAREALGTRAVVGVSCYNELARALEAGKAGASYVAFGSFFPSATKPNAVQATPRLLREAREQVTIPICAIGGITPANGGELIRNGADLLAVVSGVFEAESVRQAAERYARLFEHSPGDIHDKQGGMP